MPSFTFKLNRQLGISVIEGYVQGKGSVRTHGSPSAAAAAVATEAGDTSMK